MACKEPAEQASSPEFKASTYVLKRWGQAWWCLTLNPTLKRPALYSQSEFQDPVSNKQKQQETKKLGCGAGEMTQQLGTLAAPAENWGSIPSTCMTDYNHLELRFQRLWHPLLIPAVTRITCSIHIYTCRQDTHTHKVNVFKHLKLSIAVTCTCNVLGSREQVKDLGFGLASLAGLANMGSSSFSERPWLRT